MSVVTVSSKFQIVIPKEVREPLGIRPGQKLRVFRFGELVTVSSGWLEYAAGGRNAIAFGPTIEGREQ